MMTAGADRLSGAVRAQGCSLRHHAAGALSGCVFAQAALKGFCPRAHEMFLSCGPSDAVPYYVCA